MALILTACMTTGFAKAAPVQPDQPAAAAAAQAETRFQQIPCPLDQYFLQAQAVSAETSAKEAEGSESDDAFVDEMGADSINFSAVTSAGSRYYVFHTDMSLDQKTVLNIFDEKGQDAGTVELALGEDGFVGGCSVLPDGRVCFVTNGYDEAADQFPWEIVCMSIEPEVTQEAAAAAAANEGGQAAVTAQPGPVKATEVWKRLLSTSEDFFLRGMVSTDQGTFLLTETEIIVCSNEDGTEVKKIVLPTADFNGSITKNEAGEILLAGQDQAGIHVWKLDPAAGTYAESLIQTDHAFMLERLAPGSSGFDFYYAAEDGIYGFKTDGSAPVLVLDYAKSGLQIEAVDSCALVSAGSILMVYFNEEAGSCAVLLQAVPQQEVPQQGA